MNRLIDAFHVVGQPTESIDQNVAIGVSTWTSIRMRLRSVPGDFPMKEDMQSTISTFIPRSIGHIDEMW